MNIPTELIRLIMEYRGSDTFDALTCELNSAKLRQGQPTLKFMREFSKKLSKIEEDELIPYNEYIRILGHKYMKHYLQNLGWKPPKGWKPSNCYDIYLFYVFCKIALKS
jgi:hypothetical protein